MRLNFFSTQMGITTSIDIHSPAITLKVLGAELRKNPSRLEEKKVGTNFADPQAGNTPLMSSAELKHVEFLLSVGANVEAKNAVKIMDLFFN